MGLLLFVAPRKIFAGSVVVAAGTLAACLGSLVFGVPIDGFFFDGAWLLFAAGVLVYYRINYATGGRVWLINATFLAGIAYALMTPAKLLEPEKNVEQTLLAAFTFALVISLIHPFDGRLMSARWLRPLSFCGVMLQP